MALVLTLAGDYRDFEFQCLHGMGVELYDQITPADTLGIPCRIYAPVGSHEDLLPYLVRRLLENGANSSFVNRIVDDKAPIESLVECPVAIAKRLLPKMNHNIPLPKDIYGDVRANAAGLDIHSYGELQQLTRALNAFSDTSYQAQPIVPHWQDSGHAVQLVKSPNNCHDVVGEVIDAKKDDLTLALKNATDKPLIVMNESMQFSAGVNLSYTMNFADKGDFKSIEKFIKYFQETCKHLKYSKYPVVSAPSGLTLGGGFEVMVQSNFVASHTNIVVGLVETIVGLVPAGGGCKEMLARWLDTDAAKKDPNYAPLKVFDIIGYGKTATSPVEAEPMKYLKPQDKKIMNRNSLLEVSMEILNNNKDFKAPSELKFNLPGKTVLPEMNKILDKLYNDKVILDQIGNGGLSGKPLNNRSTEMTKYLAQKSNKSFVIIGVGGIFTAKDAQDKLNAGADLIQVYTGYVYEGPSMVKKINKSLIR